MDANYNERVLHLWMIDGGIIFWANLEWKRNSQVSSCSKRHRNVSPRAISPLNTIEDTEVEEKEAIGADTRNRLVRI